MKIEEIFTKIEKVNADIFLLEKENLDIRNKFEKSELGKQAKKQKIHMIIPDEFENNIQILGRKEEVLKGLYQEAYAIIEDHLNNKEYNLVKIYYEKLIEYGDPEASLRMGVLYEGSVYDGDFFEKDYKKALNYYKVSASLNNHSAMVNIGRMYGKGIGVDVDHEESLRWYLKSVKFLSSQACLNIAAKYINGTGVDKDHIIAGMWLYLCTIFDNFPSDRQRENSLQQVNQILDQYSDEEKQRSLSLVSAYLIENNLREMHAKVFDNNSPAQ